MRSTSSCRAVGTGTVDPLLGLGLILEPTVAAWSGESLALEPAHIQVEELALASVASYP